MSWGMEKVILFAARSRKEDFSMENAIMAAFEAAERRYRRNTK